MDERVFLIFDPSWQAALRSWHGVTRRRSRWMVLSLAAHLAVLIVVCWPVKPVFVRAEFLARGQNGRATPNSVALYLPKDIRSTEHPLLSLPAPSQQKPVHARLRQRHNVIETENPPSERTTAEAGSDAGTSLYGASEGDEVKPGFAIRFSDPRVSRSQMPSGLQGDVVVELTIDINGNVVEAKLLHGLGHGIDEMVIATLRDWHFRPATRNGIAIPFKYDAHFHFPS